MGHCCCCPATASDVEFVDIKADQICRTEEPLNSAFVFIKPHANTEQFRSFVYEKLIASGIDVVAQGWKDASEIHEKNLYDKHRFSIASSATLSKPEDLSVPADEFERKFGLSWDEAKFRKLAVNASDACAKLQVDGDGLAKLWQAAEAEKQVIRFGRDFSCGKITPAEGEPLYVFNGFFMSMRAAFTSPGQQIYYFSIAWLPDKIKSSDVSSWYLFRYAIVGETEPREANPNTLRNELFDQWEELGLKCEPDKFHNGVHASASPFEGLAERCNWLGVDLQDDGFGRRLLNAGISRKWIEEGFNNPEVNMKRGETGHLFQELENKDSQECIEKLKELHDLSHPGRVTNEAFIFVEPHAMTKKYVSHVREALQKRDISVLAEGDIAPCGHTPSELDKLSVTTTSTRASAASVSSPPSAAGSGHYYCVRWDAEHISWRSFQGSFVGPEDPALAPPTSLRGVLYSRWRDFHLKRQPGTRFNGIHASASPFEGLADRLTWLGGDIEDDTFGMVLADRGIDLGWVKDNLKNKQILDAVRNMNTDVCAQRLEQFWRVDCPLPACDVR